MGNLYSILAESIETKYNKKLTLTEAWGNAPDWLGDALSRNAGSFENNDEKMHRSKVYKKLVKDHPDWDIWKIEAEYENLKKDNRTLRRDYINPRSNSPEYGISTRDKGLFGSARRKGIDLSKCEFVETEAPTNPRDAIVNPPNIPIWSLPTLQGENQIYARGINDLEKASWQLVESELRDKRLASISVKKLSAACNHFCYIPGDKIATLDFGTQQIERREQKKFEFAKGRGTPGQTQRNRYNQPLSVRDKSGYLVVPPTVKYEKQLKELGAKKAATKLAEAHERLETVVEKYKAFMANASMEQISSKYSAIGSIASSIDDAVRQLNRCTNILDDSKLKPDPIDYISRVNLIEHIESLNKLTEYVESYGDVLLDVVDF